MLHAMLYILEENETIDTVREKVRKFIFGKGMGVIAANTETAEHIKHAYPNNPDITSGVYVIGELDDLNEFFINCMTNCSEDDEIDYDFDGMWRDAKSQLIFPLQ